MPKNKIGGQSISDTRFTSAAGASDGHLKGDAHIPHAVAGAPISPAPSGDGGGDGHKVFDAQGGHAVSNPSPTRKRRGAKRANGATTPTRSLPSSPPDPVGHAQGDTQAPVADRGEGEASRRAPTKGDLPALSTLADDLAELQFRRTTYIREVNALTNRVRAMIRRMLGWEWGMPEAERTKINKRAAAIHAAIEAGKPIAEDEAEVAAALAGDVMVFAAMRGPAELQRKTIEADMRRAARLFPAWQEWGQGVRGFGELGFAVIVAEAGDIGGYATVSKLWKRLGLAVINGERQQKKTDADLAAAHGYNPRRRAEMYAVIADPLFRQQWRGADEETGRLAGPTGPYGEVYAREKAKAAPRIEATSELTGKEKWAPLRVDRHARRLMTKALIRDLWRVWHGLPPRGQHADDSEIGPAESEVEGGGQEVLDAHYANAPTTPLPADQDSPDALRVRVGRRKRGAGQYESAAHKAEARPSP